MIKPFLLVLAGGGLGSVFRYLVSDITPKYYRRSFPLGTFIVNIVGCLVIGIFASILDMNHILNTFFVSGFCGGFTTFSTFSKDAFLLIENRKMKLAFVYITSSCILGILAVFIGFLLAGGKGLI